MAGIDHRGVRQGHQLGFDAINEGSVVARGEVGAADAAREQHVTHDDATRGKDIEADAAVGVTGGVEHLQFLPSEGDAVTLL